MILLAAINSKYIHSNPAVFSLRAYAKEYASDIEIAQYTINQQVEEILSDIYLRSPDVLVFSVYIWNRTVVDILLEEIPKIMKNCRVFLGGPEASYDAENMLKAHPYVEAVMIGEGEETFKELCGICADGKYDALENVKGLYLRSGRTGIRPLLSMDEVPFFYKEWADSEEWPFTNRIIYYETSRGCPFNCSYCLSSIDRTVRLRSLDKVYGELQFFLDRKVPQVKFTDRTFNCNAEHAEKIWEYILENDNGITNFHFEISADILTEAQLKILKEMRSGLVQLEIGVQSTNPETLKAINRRVNFKKLVDNVALINSFGNIHQHLDLIAGLPYEGPESFEKSFNDVYAMKPNQLQLGFLKVLRGTDIFESAQNYGITSYSRTPYEVMSTDWISYGDVLKLKKIEEVVETYHNSGQFVKTLPVLASLFESPYRMFKKLAGYFEEKGYFLNQPARIHRYNILLEFAVSVSPENEELFKELLTCDAYLRENMKSRPAFARDLKPFKAQIIERERSKKDHIEVFYYRILDEFAGLPLQKDAQPHFVLFDYNNIDPLDHNADIRDVSSVAMHP